MTTLIDSYSGIHSRVAPDDQGYCHFEVYRRSGSWYWSALDEFDEPRGSEHGPYRDSGEAFFSALGE